MNKPAGHESTVEYEHFIDQQLRRAQGRIKAIDVCTGLVRLGTAALVYLLVVIGLDHALVLSSLVRLILLALAAAGALAYLTIAVGVPAVRRVNQLFAAWMIERASPQFHNSLLNFLDLRRRPQQVHPSILAALEGRAVEDLSQVRIEEKISQERLVRSFYALAAVVSLVCLAILFNAMFMHRSLASSLGRALFPTASISPPTKTRLTNVAPGDDSQKSRVLAGDQVQISAIVEGQVPPKVLLFWSDDGGQFWRHQELRRPQSPFDPWQTTVTAVEKPFSYYLVGGDCRTKTYRIEVVPAPMIAGIEVRYDYPDYTGWPPYRSDNGNIDALEGTQVTITATTNQAARRAELRLGPDKRRRAAMQRVAGRQDRFSTSFTLTKDDVYRIWFWTAAGQKNPRPTLYQIKVRRDRPPKVTITEPGRDLVTPPLPANAVVPLTIEGHDDFGIEQVVLKVKRGQKLLLRTDLTSGKKVGKELRLVHPLDLATLGLSSGDQIEYWVEAADNRRPTRNHLTDADVPHYLIRVGSPADAAERARQLARAEQAEKAVEELQRPSGPTQEPAETKTAAQPADQTPQPAMSPEEAEALRKITEYFEQQDRQQQPDGSRPDEPPEGAEAQPDEAAGQQSSPKQQSAEPDKPKPPSGGQPAEQQPAEAQASDQADQQGQGQTEPANGQQAMQPAGTGSSAGQQPAGDKGQPAGRAEDRNATDGQARSQGQGQSGPAGQPEQGSSAPDGTSPGKPADSANQPGQPQEQSAGQRAGTAATSAERPASGQSAAGSRSEPAPEAMSPAGRQAQPHERRPGQPADQPSPSQSEGQRAGESAQQPQGQGREPGRQSASGQSSSSSPAEQAEGGQSGQQPPGQVNLPAGAGQSSSGRRPAGPAAGKAGQQPPRGASQQPASSPTPGSQPSAVGSADSSAAAGQQNQGQQPAGASQSSGTKSGGQAGQSDRGGGPTSSQPTAAGQAAPGQGQAGGQASSEAASAQSQPSSAGPQQQTGGGQQQPGAAGQQAKPGAQGGGKQGGGGTRSSGQQGGKGQSGAGQGRSAAGGQNAAGSPSAPGQSSGGTGATGSGNLGPSSGRPGRRPGGGRDGKPGPGPGPASAPSPAPPPPGVARRRPPAPVDLVLERLDQQLQTGRVDPALLKRLGWTQAELEQFVRRFAGPGSTTDSSHQPGRRPGAARRAPLPGSSALRQRLVRSVRRRGGQTAHDNIAENLEDIRLEPPPEYRDMVEAYRRSQSAGDER